MYWREEPLELDAVMDGSWGSGLQMTNVLPEGDQSPELQVNKGKYAGVFPVGIAGHAPRGTCFDSAGASRAYHHCLRPREKGGGLQRNGRADE
jgi:hypothetical protein